MQFQFNSVYKFSILDTRLWHLIIFEFFRRARARARSRSASRCDFTGDWSLLLLMLNFLFVTFRIYLGINFFIRCNFIRFYGEDTICLDLVSLINGVSSLRLFKYIYFPLFAISLYAELILVFYLNLVKLAFSVLWYNTHRIYPEVWKSMLFKNSYHISFLRLAQSL